jgi:hypothetical protein
VHGVLRLSATCTCKSHGTVYLPLKLPVRDDDSLAGIEDTEEAGPEYSRVSKHVREPIMGECVTSGPGRCVC